MYSRLPTTHWCLFIDDHYIERGRSGPRYGFHGLQRVMHQPQRQGLVVTKDQPCESPVIDMLSHNIIYDKERGVFRLWYNCFVRQWYEQVNAEVESMSVHYAESLDGKTWVKPNLNQYEVSGNNENNICLLAPGCGVMWAGVMHDPDEPDERRRYKMLGHGTVGRDHGVVVYFSPDGLHWEPAVSNPVLFSRVDCGDSYTLMGCRDPKTDRYVAGIRPVDWYLSYPDIPTYRYDRKHPQADEYDATSSYRKVGISFSDDFTCWTIPQTIVEADLDDPPGTQIQGMTLCPYEDMYLGFLIMYYADGAADTINIQLAASRDLLNWQRVGGRKPFLDTADEGPWKSQMLFAVHPPIEVGDELYFFYNAHRHNHYAKPSEYEAAIGLATMPKRRLVSMFADDQGFLVTRPYFINGQELLVDADTTHGELSVELLDERYNPIAGMRSLATRGDQQVHRIIWPDNQTLANYADRPIRMKFHMQNVHLYGFKIES